ncbi:MAG: hypothetical protein EOO69_04410 [Moraxellaceae bacterium]|nr:MAG: hypothetical protein EOO69_04410 [Moraxellaceae bacterium]
MTTIQDSDVIVQQPFTGAVQRTQHDKNTEYVTPADFGAQGDGTTDDTLALRAWLAADSGIHHLGGKDKVYIVAPTILNEVILPLTEGKSILGDGATIKIADNSLGFECLIGDVTGSYDLTGMIIDGVIFDYNKSNNTYSVTNGQALDQRRYTFRALKGENFKLVNNKIIGAVTTNSFVINNYQTVKRVIIENNIWVDVGGIDKFYDHSTLYIVGDYIQITNNMAFGANLGANGTACFAEVHGSYMNITNNQVFNFQGFCNYCGIYRGGDTRYGIIANNVAEVVRFGIRLFSLIYGVHDSGYGIDGLNILGNYFRIHQTVLGADPNLVGIGIGFQAGSDLPSKNISIKSNTLAFDEETTAPQYTARIVGLGVNESSSYNQVFENIDISENLIVNAPNAAINYGAGGGIYKNCSIGTNTIINSGQSLAANHTSLSDHSAIRLSAYSFIGTLKIAGQNIVDTFDTSRLQTALYLSSNLDSSSCYIDAEILINLQGANKNSFVRPVNNINSLTRPHFKITINKTPGITSHIFPVGCEILDTTSNLNYKTVLEGSAWITEGYSSSKPTVLSLVGSRRINMNPTAGGFIGWVQTGTTASSWRGYGLIET